MSINKEYHVIALMSGTSLDGVDIVKCIFKQKKTWKFQIECEETIKYTKSWTKILKKLHLKSNSEINKINIKYAEFLADIINSFIKKHSLKADFIASHGHTIFHQPENKITLQIGCGSTIAKITKLKTITNFRYTDIILGGQGAPLVPVGDLLLFPNYKYCLNLGGFANISIKKRHKIIAYDICPVNFVLNHLSHKLELEFDYNGSLAKKGSLNIDLLNKLNKLEFYKKNAPKSLSREWVEKNIFPLIKYDIPIIDWMHTFCEHIALQISPILQHKSTLITGGGAFNKYLLNRIRNYSNSKLILPNKQIINMKEAIIFGFLGVLKIRNEINCFSSVTGANKDSSVGEIFEYS